MEKAILQLIRMVSVWFKMEDVGDNDMVNITAKVTVPADRDAGVWVNANLITEGSNLTECCQQKESRADHYPLVVWKEDPSSPHNHNIINNHLGTARGYTSDGYMKENGGYDTKNEANSVWTNSGFSVAKLDITNFSDNVFPALSTSTERIWIAKPDIHAVQYMVAKAKERQIRINIASVGRDFSPRRLWTEVRSLVVI
jgi:hypothetical protein